MFFAILCVGLSFKTYSQVSDVFYYVSDGDDRLYTINRNTGAIVNIGPTGRGAIEAIAYYPIPGFQTLYAADAGDFGRLNVTTGAFTLIGEIDGGGVARGSAGNQSLNDVDGLMLDGQSLIMWAIERKTPGVDLLFQINLTTGRFVSNAFGDGVDYLEIVGDGINVDVDDIAVDPKTGEIYGVSNDGGANDVLFKVNKSTGVFEFVATLSENDIEGLSFSNDGRLYGSEGDGDNRLGEINITTGVISNFRTFIGNGSDVEALASLVAPANNITGTVFNDTNRNGIKDDGAGGIQGVSVYLYLDKNGDGRVDPEDTRIQSTLTDASGNYQFFYITTGTLLMSTEPNTWNAGGSTRAITTDNIETAVFTDAVDFGETDINNDFGLSVFLPADDCDGDGLPDFFEGTIDTDGDGIQNRCDLDSDNDGIRDDVEGADDFDDDGIPNYLDLDSDDDGIPDAIEANRGVIRAEYVAANGNLSGVDADNDGIIDSIELPGNQLPAPYNSDNDDNPDYLDLDSDNDGILDIREAGGTADTDGDGQVDNPTDANNNGYADALETTPLPLTNTDSAYETSQGFPLLPNYIDIDSDNDGIDDTREGQSTSGYRFPSFIADIDDDGIVDFWDVSSGLNPIIPYDNDFDGLPDYIDTNSDNDAESDAIEGNDANFNGIPDITPLNVDANGNGMDDAFDGNCVTGTSLTIASTDTDRAEQNVSGGAIDLTSSDIEFLNDGTTNQIIGIRYRNVNIAQGATIASANIQFLADLNTSGAVTVRIRGQLSTNAPAFTTAGSNVSSRTTTSAFQDWSPPSWTGGESGTAQRTVDIANIIQQIVNQGGWVSGNSIVIIFSGATGQAGFRRSENESSLVIQINQGPSQVCSSNVSLPDEDADGEYDFRETDIIDSDFDGIADDIDIDDDNDGITDIDEGVGVVCPNITITGVTTDLLTVGSIATLYDGNLTQQTFYFQDNQAFTVARTIFGIQFSQQVVVKQLSVLVDRTISFIENGVQFRVQGSNDNSTWTNITGAGIITSNGVSEGDAEVISLAGNTTPYLYYRLRWLAGGQIGWDPWIEEIVFTTDCTPTSRDSDGDGIPDYLDLDSDNDGILDITEAGGGIYDANQDGRVDNYIEGLGPDGLSSVFEPGRVGNSANLPNLDTDGDGFKDYIDLDSDNDGIFDIVEAGGQDLNSDGRADISADGDNDGITNIFDINNGGSPLADNDFDGDGFPNRIDIDSDGDGIVDVIESQITSGAPRKALGNDTDGDGIDNAFDSNNGGTPTVLVDTDGDGKPDYLDINSDNDGLVDAIEGWDTNGNSIANITPAGSDADGDGLDDAYDQVNGRNSTTNVIDTPGGNTGQSANDYPNVTTPSNPERDWREVNVIDTDLDGIPDTIDIDDDNDGVLDVNEGCIDTVVTGANASAASQITATVNTPANAINGDNTNFAAFTNNNALMEIILRSGNIVSTGTAISIRARKTDANAANRMIVTQSSDGINYTNSETFAFTSTNVYEVKNYTLASNAIRIRILFDRSGGNLNISNVSYATFTIPCTGTDTDGDGIPNHLDLDSDNDGIFDIIEAGGVDVNRDGRVDVFADSDNDGWANLYDNIGAGQNGTPHPDPDTDGDGKKNRVDIDSDGDGITDLIESQITTGTPIVPVGVDSDQDGIDNAFDINCTPCGAVTGVPTVPVNTDGIDNVDYLDTDSDNDGLPDLIEGWDTNGNYLASTSPLGTDADNDGLDDAFDLILGPNALNNSKNNQTANSFPDITTASATTQRDWRETNRVTCAPGEVDGNLLLWLKADIGGIDWRDQSNNYVSLNRTGTPTVGSLNFNPTNRFVGGSFYTTNLNINSGTHPDLAVIAVYVPSVNSAGSVWGENNGNFDRYQQDISGQNDAVSNGTGVQTGPQTLFTNGVPTLSSVIFDEDVSNGSRIFVNGKVETTFTSNHGPATSNTLQIASDGTGLNRFNGDIAEVIVYSQLLEGTNVRQRIESYLALKYGITMSDNPDGDANVLEAGEGDYLASSGILFWDANEVVGQNFQNNVFGIARDDDSCLNQKQSQSSNSDGIVTIGLDSNQNGLETSNALNGSSFATDLSALMTGHDGASLYDKSANIDYDPAQITSRLNREWRVQETGTVGQITIRFDVSNLIGPGDVVGANDEALIVLLVDADGDFSSGASIVTQSFVVDSDGLVNFQVDFADGNYYTLGSSEDNALPITLLSFGGEPKNDHIVINWSTTSEINNSLYRIERSADGRFFEPIAYLDGAGTAEDINNYEVFDNDPLIGKNYYRLIDIDNNGIENASEMILIEYFKTLNIDLRPYPNPIDKGATLYIDLDQELKLSGVTLHHINGSEIPVKTERTKDRLAVYPSQVEQGIYMLSIRVNGRQMNFKVMVKH
jgi:hypothetical protein